MITRSRPTAITTSGASLWRNMDFRLTDAEFARVAAPTLVLWGGADIWLAASQADRLAARIPDATATVTVTGIAQEPDSVAATLSKGGPLHARYLPAADGTHSVARERSGIGFTGGTTPKSFTLADVRLSGGVPTDEVILFFSPAGPVVVAPLPVDRFRIVATVDEAPHDPDITFVQGLLDERGPQSHPVLVEEVVWGPVSASTTGGSTSPQGTV